MRIFELAKEIGMDSKELLVKLKSLNFPVKSHMSSVDDDTAEIIKHEVGDLQKKEIEENVVIVDFPIVVKDLAVKLGMKPSELMKDLIRQGKFFTINQKIEEETARTIAYQYKINLKKKLTKEEEILTSDSKDLKRRNPIITLMGHIDHGKTSILDYIRKSRIATRETGGITQHIGAYRVELPKGAITFFDTPGHETFTAMRARGADVTDIVVIVIAADEGVKPQTLEAIDHAKASSSVIIVAINKIDRPNADVDMVKQQLSKLELVPEDWGGTTITKGVSATTGEGIDELLDLILLQAEVMELTADYDRSGMGVVVEAKLSKGKGALVSILVQAGRVRTGDWAVCGLCWGKIKAMHDDRGNLTKCAEPAHPVEILGLNGVPQPGEQLLVAPNEKSARQIAEKRRNEAEASKVIPASHFKLEDLFKKTSEGEKKQLKIVLKADVGGTLEAVEEALAKLPSNEVELVITHKGVGAINSSDVLLADVTDSVVVGFKVSMDAQVRDLSRTKGIETRSYQIVYELLDDITAALEGLLAPQIKRTFVGRALVKTVFKLSKAGVIAGCQVEKGKILRGAACELTRGKEVIHKGKVVTLKRFKDDVKEVIEGFECGIGINYDKLSADDMIDIFQEETITRRLK